VKPSTGMPPPAPIVHCCACYPGLKVIGEGGEGVLFGVRGVCCPRHGRKKKIHREKLSERVKRRGYSGNMGVRGLEVVWVP